MILFSWLPAAGLAAFVLLDVSGLEEEEEAARCVVRSSWSKPTKP